MSPEEKKEHVKKQNKISTIILVVGAVAIAVFFGKDLFKKSSPPPEEPKKENTFMLQQESVAEEFEFFGNLEANKEAKLSSKVSGRVASFKVKEGDMVRKGQLLVVISPDQNAINLGNTTENFDKFQDYRYNQESYLNKQVHIAEENLSVAKAKRSYDEKHDPNHVDISQQEVDRANEELDTAQKNRDAQKDFNRQLAGNLKGDTRIANQNVVDTRILAPFNGIVTRKYAEEGEVVNTSVGGLLLSVAEVSSYKVVVDAPDTLIERLALGLKARVILDGISAEQSGTVTLINPKVDATAKKVQVEVRLDSIPPNVKVSMFSRVYIKFPPRTVYAVPSNFVFSGFKGPFVKLEDGTQQIIQRGNEFDGKTEIAFAGIANGITLKRNSNGNGK